MKRLVEDSKYNIWWYQNRWKFELGVYVAGAIIGALFIAAFASSFVIFPLLPVAVWITMAAVMTLCNFMLIGETLAKNTTKGKQLSEKAGVACFGEDILKPASW